MNSNLDDFEFVAFSCKGSVITTSHVSHLVLPNLKTEIELT
jgi:hypothetical protein